MGLHTLNLPFRAAPSLKHGSRCFFAWMASNIQVELKLSVDSWTEATQDGSQDTVEVSCQHPTLG